MQELSIIVKTDHVKVTEKEIIFDPLLMTLDNPYLIEKVRNVVQKMGLLPEEESPKILVKSVLYWQN